MIFWTQLDPRCTEKPHSIVPWPNALPFLRVSSAKERRRRRPWGYPELFHRRTVVHLSLLRWKSILALRWEMRRVSHSRPLLFGPFIVLVNITLQLLNCACWLKKSLAMRNIVCESHSWLLGNRRTKILWSKCNTVNSTWSLCMSQ